MGRRAVYHPTSYRRAAARRAGLARFRQHLGAHVGGLATGIARSKTAAYLWVLFSVLCFVSVIAGTGGLESLLVGAVVGVLAVRRVHDIAEAEHRADQESHAADSRDHDVAWWLDRFSSSEILQERLAAHDLLTYWGVRVPTAASTERQARRDAEQAAATERRRQERDRAADAALERFAEEMTQARARWRLPVIHHTVTGDASDTVVDHRPE